MTAEQLDRIERELGVTLPADYRAVMLAYPFVKPANDWLYWLPDDPDYVIGATRFPLNEYYDGRGWLWSYVAIGETGGGDQYFIDTSLQQSPVYFLSHETHDFEVDYPNLDAMVREYLDWQAEQARPRTWRERWRAFWNWPWGG